MNAAPACDEHARSYGNQFSACICMRFPVFSMGGCTNRHSIAFARDKGIWVHGKCSAVPIQGGAKNTAVVWLRWRALSAVSCISSLHCDVHTQSSLEMWLLPCLCASPQQPPTLDNPNLHSALVPTIAVSSCITAVVPQPQADVTAHQCGVHFGHIPFSNFWLVLLFESLSLLVELCIWYPPFPASTSFFVVFIYNHNSKASVAHVHCHPPWHIPCDHLSCHHSGMWHGWCRADVYDRMTIFEDHMIRDINAGRFRDNTSLVLLTHGLALRVFLMRWFHWTVDQFMNVYNPPNAEVSASYNITPSHIIPYHVISFPHHIISKHIISYQTYHLTTYHIMVRMSCDIKDCSEVLCSMCNGFLESKSRLIFGCCWPMEGWGDHMSIAVVDLGWNIYSPAISIRLLLTQAVPCLAHDV